jgi:hypothetical protein
VGKDRSLPQSGAPEGFFTRVGSGLTHKHKTRLERLARNKYSSLSRKSVNYGRNKFYDTGPKGTFFDARSCFFQTDKKQNATIFSIAPSDSADPEQSFSVHTNNVDEAARLVRPVRLDRLPIFKRILSNLIPM